MKSSKIKLLILENDPKIIEIITKFLKNIDIIEYLTINSIPELMTSGMKFDPDVLFISYELDKQGIIEIVKMIPSYSPFLNIILCIKKDTDPCSLNEIILENDLLFMQKPLNKNEFIFNIISCAKKTKKLKELTFKNLELKKNIDKKDLSNKKNEEFDLNKENKIAVDPNSTQELFRLFAERSSDVFWLIDPLTGEIQYVSPNVEKLRGFTADEVIKQKPHEWLTPDSIKKMMASWQEEFILMKKGIEDKRRWKTIELEQICKDGSTIWTEAIGTKLLDENGNIYSFMGITRNIEKRKQLEDELLNNNEKLQKLVEERTEKLKKAQRMEAVGLVAGSVAHDLNNILGAIIGYPGFIRSIVPEHIPQKEIIEKYLNIIEDSGKRSALIVSDMLSFANINIMNRKIKNLNDIISHYINSPEYFNLLKRYPNIKIDTDLKLSLKNIIVNETSIFKIIMNLCNNAGDAIIGEGRIKISTSNIITNELEYAYLKIEDNGVGINKDDIKKIFEPFYTKKELGRKGTGLGMTIIKNTVEDYNGFIEVTSELKKGTTFHIYIPSTDKTAEICESKINIDNFKGNEHIYIVDDYEAQREMLTVMLSTLGYQITCASTGKEVINYLKDNNADLLILDMKLNNETGLDIYNEIKKFKPDQKTVIVSGFTKPETIEEVKRAGIKQFIKKPYTINEIGNAVRQELDN